MGALISTPNKQPFCYEDKIIIINDKVDWKMIEFNLETLEDTKKSSLNAYPSDMLFLKDGNLLIIEQFPARCQLKVIDTDFRLVVERRYDSNTTNYELHEFENKLTGEVELIRCEIGGIGSIYHVVSSLTIPAAVGHTVVVEKRLPCQNIRVVHGVLVLPGELVLFVQTSETDLSILVSYDLKTYVHNKYDCLLHAFSSIVFSISSKELLKPVKLLKNEYKNGKNHFLCAGRNQHDIIIFNSNGNQFNLYLKSDIRGLDEFCFDHYNNDIIVSFTSTQNKQGFEIWHQDDCDKNKWSYVTDFALGRVYFPSYNTSDHRKPFYCTRDRKIVTVINHRTNIVDMKTREILKEFTYRNSSIYKDGHSDWVLRSVDFLKTQEAVSQLSEVLLNMIVVYVD